MVAAKPGLTIGHSRQTDTQLHKLPEFAPLDRFAFETGC